MEVDVRAAAELLDDRLHVDVSVCERDRERLECAVILLDGVGEGLLLGLKYRVEQASGDPGRKWVVDVEVGELGRVAVGDDKRAV